MSVAKVIPPVVKTPKKGAVAVCAKSKRGSVFRTLPRKGVIQIDLSNTPEQERWIYENPEIMAGLLEGLDQVENGNVHRLSESSQYFLNKDDELDKERK